MDSEGSDWIIKTVDSEDSRPVWVLIWGGPNCLAQALWKVKETRSVQDVEKFVKKLRVYAISDQDDSGPWIRKTFKDLFYIVSPDIINLEVIIMQHGVVSVVINFMGVLLELILRLSIIRG